MCSNEKMIESTNTARIAGNWVVWNNKTESITLITKHEPMKYYEKRGYKVLSPLKLHTFKQTLPSEYAFPSAHGLGIANDPENTI